MSSRVDDRVVEMRFDNKQFEAGVSTSINTIDKLKKSLNFDGAAKGFNDLEKASKRLQQLCERLGFPNMSMHDLRHQNASIMLRMGIPDKYAMERGGWSSPSVMKKVYQHTMSDGRLDAETTMNDYFQSLT